MVCVTATGYTLIYTSCMLCIHAHHVSLHITQGADTVIYERLDHANPLNQGLKEATTAHMEEYGSAGLRTLCLSYAIIDPTWYQEWQVRGKRISQHAWFLSGIHVERLLFKRLVWWKKSWVAYV